VPCRTAGVSGPQNKARLCKSFLLRSLKCPIPNAPFLLAMYRMRGIERKIEGEEGT
jgi:hypothetical protein